MLNKNSLGRVRLVVGVALSALLAGCATGIEGSREPPFDWVANSQANGCEALTGSYLAAGIPAPANAQASTYGVVWPTEGSLLSIVELGSNANPRKAHHLEAETKLENIVLSVSIDSAAAGAIGFDAKNAKGETEELRPQTWSCEQGMLVTRVALGSLFTDSYVRLWKHGNDLIAEQTVGATRHAQAMDAKEQKPVARFHFKFRSTMN
jgi:hypothetical protein